MSSFEDIRKMQAQKEVRKLEEEKRAEAEGRENQCRYNKAKERAERARQSFLMAQEAQNNRILHHFSSLIPEILEEFGQLIYGNSIEKKVEVEYTRGFLGLGSSISQIVREISYKSYKVYPQYFDGNKYFVLVRIHSIEEQENSIDIRRPGYYVQLLSQKKQFTEQYLRLKNGIEKANDYSLDAHVYMEYCRVFYGHIIQLQGEPITDAWGIPALDEYGNRRYNRRDDEMFEESPIMDMIKLQRSEIEKALTEIWQARRSKD